MSWVNVFASRLRSLFLRNRPEREIEDEIRFHLEMQAEDHEKAGLSSQEAHYAALRSFGKVDQAKETLRERRTFFWLDTVFRDLSFGLRSLRRRPAFTIAAGLSLALGIGVTTAIFTILNAAVLRPLPYKGPDRLIWMTTILKKNSTDEVTLTAHFLEWRLQNRSFTDLAGFNYQTRNLTGVHEPLELRTARASASLLPLLGVQPVLGRNFLKREDYKGRDQVAVLTYPLWRDQFGADPKILGKAISLDGSPFTVVGILPPDFVFPGPDQVQLITPLGKDEAAELQYKIGSVIQNIVGRLKPGVTLQQARTDLTVVQSRLPVPAFRPIITIKMEPLRAHLFGNAKAASLVLIAAAGFLLLIACANVSNLLLARWMQRDREMAIRLALGSSRRRLAVQLLAESALLGVFSCALGIVLAYWIRAPLLVLSPYQLPGVRTLPFDGNVLGFGIALGLLTTILFGALPALRATNVRLTGAIQAGQTAVVSGRGSLRMLSLIAAAEIATTLVLSIGAGLMLQSFWKLRYANLGFQPDHLVAATLDLPHSTYRDGAARAAFVQRLIERAQSLPGVELAATVSAGEIPPGEGHATNTFAIEGRNQPLGGPRPIARYPVVSPSYFGIVGIPLIQGRLLQDSDGPGAPLVVDVSQALVRRYFSNENPIGQRIRIGGNDRPWRTIAGVAGDAKTSGLHSAPEPVIYLPYEQLDIRDAVGIVMRSPLNAGTVATEFRKMVADLDPNQPVAGVQAMSDRLSESVSGPRFTTVLLFAFAGLAVVLGLIGVYGVMSCRIRWQLRELALRQALGAQRKDVVWHVLRQGFTILSPGLLAGLIASLLLTRLLSSMLYEVRPHDAGTFAALCAGIAAAALLACLIPAVKASRLDPLTWLRHE